MMREEIMVWRVVLKLLQNFKIIGSGNVLKIVLGFLNLSEGDYPI